MVKSTEENKWSINTTPNDAHGQLAEEDKVETDDSAHLREQVAVLQRQLQQERNLREKDRKLLEIRRRELEEVQAFVDLADSVSGEEIISLIEALNSDVLQLAASIADSDNFIDDYQCAQDVVDKAVRFFGPTLCNLLHANRNQDQERREFIIQAALQAALLWACSDITGRWMPHLDFSSVERAYIAIQSSCSQASAGRWRAMTRSRFKYARPSDVAAEATNRCALAIQLVLQLSGHEAASRPWPSTTCSLIVERFGIPLDRIVTTTIKLDRAMSEQMISYHAELVMVTSGQRFHSNWMENGYSGDAGCGDGVVACTLGLGLQLSARNSQGQEVKSFPLKAKVVFMNYLLDIEN